MRISINMDPMQPLPPFFYEIFDASLPRLGPGNANLTRKAIGMLPESIKQRGREIRMLDLGCGTGVPTIELAKQIDGTIVAVDNHQPYLDELRRRAEAENVSEKIRPLLGNMFHLEFEDGSFDLIWSEGALYMMGIRDALKTCGRLLKPGGFLGVSDMIWLKPDPPEPCRQFLEAECSFLADLDAVMAMMEEGGYEVLAHFTLPESAWLDNFYCPLEDRVRRLREKYGEADPEKIALFEATEREIDMYRNYSAYYGYEFFLLKHR
jgi:ubiquinone/menaquinone biosynthesis C-methylase UbiE